MGTSWAVPARFVACLLVLLAQRAAGAKNLTAAVAPLGGRAFRCVHTQELTGDGFFSFKDPALVVSAPAAHHGRWKLLASLSCASLAVPGSASP